jgi:hypothetical protein
MVRARDVEHTEAFYQSHAVDPPSPRSFSLTDAYALLLTAVLLILGLPVLFFNLVWLAPSIALIAMWGLYVKVGTDDVPRGCCFFLVTLLICTLSAPCIVATFLWSWAIRLLVFVTSCPVGVLLCCHNPLKSRTALVPFMGAPGVVSASGEARSPIEKLAQKYGWCFRPTDVIVALMGSCHRQGACDTYLAFATMTWVIPPLKFAISANYWLYELEEVFINQWSEPFDLNADGSVKTEQDEELLRPLLWNMVGRPKLKQRNVDVVDAWPFLGHFPYPPPSRESKTATGLQFSDGVLLVTLLPHVAHPTERDQKGLLQNISGHAPRSKTGTFTVVSVYLQAWNPLYHLTGYVEVNTHVNGGAEHPMWLVCAARTSRLHASLLIGVNRLFVRLGLHLGELVRAQPEYMEKQTLTA